MQGEDELWDPPFALMKKKNIVLCCFNLSVLMRAPWYILLRHHLETTHVDGINGFLSLVVWFKELTRNPTDLTFLQDFGMGDCNVSIGFCDVQGYRTSI